MIPRSLSSRRRQAPVAVLAAMLLAAAAAHAADTSAARQLERWSAASGAPRDAERGRIFFTSRHGGEWSCASCHRDAPLTPGRHASTGKAIDPIAPAANPAAFTDTARVDKWFRRNCKDVLGRECSAREKADVLAYLLGLGR